VGRYFMEHPGVLGAVFLPTNPALPLKLYQGNSAVPHGFLCPSAETQRRERVLNFRIFVAAAPELEVMRASIDGVRAAHELIESARRAKLDDDFGIHVRQVAADLEEEALYAYKAFFRRDERLPAYFLPMGMEQEPNPNSRVMLTDEHDSLGMPRIALDWRFGELEERTFHRGVEILASEVGRMGLGRVKLLPDNVIPAGSGLHSGTRAVGWPRSIEGQYHHMGTTRMARDPKHGVVNADCRVHGIDNLFIGGSSVFPTVGYTNPTLTIVALSLRLADHLKELLR
jgi:choline dehydrogenase-like flavoprotein